MGNKELYSSILIIEITFSFQSKWQDSYGNIKLVQWYNCFEEEFKSEDISDRNTVHGF